MYYQGTAKYQKEDENGRLKLVSEQYLLNAVSFTEAETKMYEFLGENVRGEFKVKSISESGITDVFDFDDGGIYYQTIVNYFVVEESGKEKLLRNKILVEANSIIQAVERTIESLNNMLVSFYVSEAKESKIIELIEHKTEEVEQAEADKDLF